MRPSYVQCSDAWFTIFITVTRPHNRRSQLFLSPVTLLRLHFAALLFPYSLSPQVKRFFARILIIFLLLGLCRIVLCLDLGSIIQLRLWSIRPIVHAFFRLPHSRHGFSSLLFRSSKSEKPKYHVNKKQVESVRSERIECKQ